MTEATDRAKPFRDMAEKIDLNRSNGFCGAFVLVPPGIGFAATLVLNDEENPAMFWSLVKTRAEIEIGKLDDAERNPGFGRGR